MPVWLYRFAYVSEAQRGRTMGTLHGYEIPFTIDVPQGLVGDKVTPTDKAMADAGQRLLGGLRAQPAIRTVRAGRRGRSTTRPLDRLLHFTNSGVIVGTDPLKERLDLWQRMLSR